MKRKLLFIIISVFACLACSNENPLVKYNAVQEKYNGTYIVRTITTDNTAHYDLFGDVAAKNLPANDINIQFQTAVKERTAMKNIGYAYLQIYTSGSGKVSLVMCTQAILSDTFPPYTVDTEVSNAMNIVTVGQDIPLQVGDDMTVRFFDGIPQRNEYDIVRTLMGPARITDISEKSMTIRIEEFPIYDHAQKKISVIPITYYLERE